MLNAFGLQLLPHYAQHNRLKPSYIYRTQVLGAQLKALIHIWTQPFLMLAEGLACQMQVQHFSHAGCMQE